MAVHKDGVEGQPLLELLDSDAVAALPHPYLRRLRWHQQLLAATSALILLVAVVWMPDVGLTMLLSVTVSCALCLAGLLPRLAVPATTSGPSEALLCRRVYRCSNVAAACDLMTLAWWGVVLVLMLRDPDQAMRDALLLLVAVGCGVLALHAALCAVVAQDAARLGRCLGVVEHTPAGAMGWWVVWALLGVTLAVALLLVGCAAAFLIMALGGVDCVPTLSLSK